MDDKILTEAMKTIGARGGRANTKAQKLARSLNAEKARKALAKKRNGKRKAKR